MRSRFVVLASPLLAVLRCVGDDSTIPDASMDATADTTVMDTSPPKDGPVGDGGDGGPTCILPDAASGTLDTTFATGLKAFGANHFDTRAATVDSQGTIYVFGSAAICADGGTFGYAIAHILENGSIDPVFTQNGNPLCLAPAPLNIGLTATMLPSNAPLFGGASGNGTTTGYGLLASYTGDASANTGFNLTGTLALPQAAGTTTGGGCGSATISDTSNAFTTINALAVSSTGKIAVVGSNAVAACGINDFIPTGTAGFVLQLNSDGTTDGAFNSGTPLKDGTVTGYYGVAYDAAGNLVVVGQGFADASSSMTTSILRYTSTGGTDGSLQLSATGGIVGRSVTVLADGNIMVAGSSNLTAGTYAGPLTIVRLTSGLALDTTFNGGAPLTVPMTFDAYTQYSSLAVLCNGEVLAAGTWHDDAGDQNLGLARITTAGALDPTFGQGGVTNDPFTGAEIPVGVAQDPTTGKVVVIGRNTTPQLVIARFNP
jgi:uncharacterized delta-60 repeat protein